MKIEVNGKNYEIIITKKISTKNTYIRIKEDLKIYVTSNKLTSDQKIREIINKNYAFIEKRITQMEKSNLRKKDFYYLGKKYNIIYSHNKSVLLGEEDVLINKDYDLNKWYKKQAEIIFKEELDKIYRIFPYKIPYPTLMIRTMKTRWGVCNTKLIKITLNQELIKKDLIYIDYVIVHELSHLIHADHSKKFWQVVSLVMPNYKIIRKELRYNE